MSLFIIIIIIIYWPAFIIIIIIYWPAFIIIIIIIIIVKVIKKSFENFPESIAIWYYYYESNKQKHLKNFQKA